MTTRRGLFGWLAGALALGAGLKASAGAVPDFGKLRLPPAGVWFGPQEKLVDVDTALARMWASYKLNPTHVISDGETYELDDTDPA